MSEKFRFDEEWGLRNFRVEGEGRLRNFRACRGGVSVIWEI